MQIDKHISEVWDALRGVTDPELDESVVALGFICDLAVDGGRVKVSFRLPTFWCSANFAFIMAEDMRRALEGLDWVEHSEIALVDHFAAERINAGIAGAMPFEEAFDRSAGGDLAGLRESFRRKAFLGRMSELIDAMRESGMSATKILATRIGDLRMEHFGYSIRRAADRYLELRGEYGGSCDVDQPAFRTPEGADIAPDALRDFLRSIRMTRRSAEANATMCRMLLEARMQKPAKIDRAVRAAPETSR